MTTDIIVCTKNRLPILKRTLAYLFERTTSPYRLHVIDDASTEGNQEYLRGLYADRKLAGLVLRSKSEHMGSNWNLAPWLAQSDVLVWTDDDVLCPKIQPDWLSRGLSAMKAYPKMGLLTLHCPLIPMSVADFPRPIVIKDRVGGQLMFARRDLMRSIVIPPVGGVMHKFKVLPNSEKLHWGWSAAVMAKGYAVGFLTDVYCQHIGAHSERRDEDLKLWGVMEVNPDTLEMVYGH
jgi:glycosyltransferase involved in cell wall biosynthesis